MAEVLVLHGTSQKDFLEDEMFVVPLVCSWRHGSHAGGQEQKSLNSARNLIVCFRTNSAKNSAKKKSFTNMEAWSRDCKPRNQSFQTVKECGSIKYILPFGIGHRAKHF